MLGGGVPEGDSLLVAGPFGTGKSVLATQFIAEGQKNGEPGIIAVFEERPDYYVGRADAFGLDLEAGRKSGMLKVVYLRPLDLSVDEAMQEILDAVQKIGAKRLVIDSLTGFEMALASGFRTDFRESLYRMIAALTGIGVTVLSTVEIEDSFTALAFSNYSISFLTDDLIRLRYVEIKVGTPQDHDRHQDAWWEPQQSDPGIQNYLRWYGHGWISAYELSRSATGVPEPLNSSATNQESADEPKNGK